jgi:uncharacterized protein with HEPN domain
VIRDRAYLVYITEAIASVHDLTAQGREAFSAAKHDQAAVLYYLQTLTEVTQRISEELKASHPEIDWIAIAGFRNRLVHGYLTVNLDIVWSIVENHLGPLQSVVDAMLQVLDEQEQGSGE